MTTATTTDFAALYEKADAYGFEAAEAATPTPVIFGQAVGLTEQIDYTKPTYYEAEGLCGFAWIKFKGNTAFGRWAKKEGYARPAYGGGLQIRVAGFGQSIARKEAYAHAFAQVLRAAGIEAYADSRLD